MVSINWISTGFQEYMATVGHVRVYAGINGDGAVYWSNGLDKGRATPLSLPGTNDPMAYATAAIENAKRDAEVWARKQIEG